MKSILLCVCAGSVGLGLGLHLYHIHEDNQAISKQDALSLREIVELSGDQQVIDTFNEYVASGEISVQEENLLREELKKHNPVKDEDVVLYR